MLQMIVGFGITAIAIAKWRAKNRDPIICDEVAPLPEPFEAPRYMGKWYAIQHTSGAAFQPDFYYNTTAIYSDLNEETGIFKVHNSSTIKKFLPRVGVHGTASTVGCPNGQCAVNFFG